LKIVQAYDGVPKAESLRLLPDEPDRAYISSTLFGASLAFTSRTASFMSATIVMLAIPEPAVLLHRGAQSRSEMQGGIELGVRHCHGWTGARPGRNVRSLGAFYYAG
jgi:hypothetical protein